MYTHACTRNRWQNKQTHPAQHKYQNNLSMENSNLHQALADIQTRLHAAEQRVRQNHYLQQDLDASLQGMISYMPVVETARRDVLELREEVIEEFRRIALQAVVSNVAGRGWC